MESQTIITCERTNLAKIIGETVIVVNNNNGVVAGLLSRNGETRIGLQGIQIGLWHHSTYPFGHRYHTCHQNPKFCIKNQTLEQKENNNEEAEVLVTEGGFDTVGERMREARGCVRERRVVVGLKKRQVREECGSHVQMFLFAQTSTK